MDLRHFAVSKNYHHRCKFNDLFNLAPLRSSKRVTHFCPFYKLVLIRLSKLKKDMDDGIQQMLINSFFQNKILSNINLIFIIY